MLDTENSCSYDASAGSSFASDEASPTLCMYEKDMERETNRVIWQASQPQDPVLRKLLNEAHAPQDAPSIVPARSWTPSLSSFTNDALSSRTNTMDKSSRAHRPFKRRSSSTNIVQPAANSSVSENDLEKRVRKFVALVPIVSKQIEENVRREEEALRRKRREEKEKKAALLVESSLMTKNRRKPANGKGKQRAADNGHVEEELTAVEEPSASKEGKHNLNLRRSSRSESPLDMPPPSFVPLRKSWSCDNNFPSSTSQCNDLKSSTSRKDGSNFEHPSFTPSSFVASSTPRPASDVVPDNSTHLGRVDLAPAKEEPASATELQASLPTNSQPPSRTSPPAARNPDPPPNPSPTFVTQQNSQRLPAPQLHPIPKSKSTGPPVLGMRRLPSSQVTYLSQNRPLPVKQDKFRVPFARPKSEGPPGTPAAISRSAPPGSDRPRVSSSAVRSCCSAPGGTGYVKATTSASHIQPSTDVSKRSSSSSPSSNPRFETAGALVSKDNDRSPSPPADADSSIEYDMDIDREELEKACRMYD